MARVEGDFERSRAALEDAGLALAKARPDDSGEVLVLARRGGLRSPRLHVELWAFAPALMDIRTRLPTEQLDTEPCVTARWHLRPFELPDLPPDTPKIVVSQRPGRYPEPYLRQWLAETLAKGWLPVLETDDHPGVMARVQAREPDALDWLQVRAMAAVQTSTPRLAEALAEHNPEVRVFPNAVFELPPFPTRERPRRVFYGAVSRGPLAVEVARSLGPVVRQFPDVEFLVVGDRAVFDALPTRRKRYEDIVPYDRYLAVMRACSVTLSPLAGNAYEDTKSDAKFLDAAQSGTLMIASPTVYSDVIRHGENGLIAQRTQDWPRLLADALGNDAKRREMTLCAWSEVRERRMFADQIAARRDWYLDLWDRREALERALCERLPGLADAIAHHRR
ncbi:glycosyltransferase family protein [Phenylobacterium sp. VNQ135]|uniref:glycosyltransferase family protein n=1 Tax=Phenylobacterium sp. VNQ135 TaxID=3400922 RepID=UPI003C2EFFE2